MTCAKCGGTGNYLGIGFMLVDCTQCEEIEEAPTLDEINRKSKSYLKAIKDLMALNKGITRKDAVKMFDEAYAKGG